jgi:2-iminobutanoate/2-iminopropanoate deaminase
MSQREVISLPGIPHNAPLPTGARIGNIVRSSALSGRDPDTNDFSDDPDRQAAVLFENVRRFMEKAGGSPDNIIHLTLYVKELRYNEVLDKEWVAMFPDAENRPARETIIKTEGMYGGRFFEAALMAVL